MSAKNKYTSEFKKTIVNLYHSGKSYAQIHNEYGVSSSALSKWPHRSSSVRELENRSISAAILEPYAKTDKRLGTRKIKDCINRDYCINISRGRVYRLMKTMNLPKMSTVKPPKTPQIKPTRKLGYAYRPHRLLAYARIFHFNHRFVFL